jgi:hypothetical protein
MWQKSLMLIFIIPPLSNPHACLTWWCPPFLQHVSNILPCQTCDIIYYFCFETAVSAPLRWDIFRNIFNAFYSAPCMYTIIVFCWGQYEFLWTLKTIFTEAFRLRWIWLSKVHKNSYWPIQKTVIVLLH